jgi:hypothetical protein
MEAGLSRSRLQRVQYRHELRSLTYAILDQSNGGVVRNLTSEGLGLQVMSAVPPGQQMQLRFELRSPRLRVETRGEVVWSTFSGLCGIRFLDLSPRLGQQVKQWIFGDMLEGAAMHAQKAEPMFAGPAAELPAADEAPEDDGDQVEDAVDDGLMVSATALKVIELPTRPDPPPEPALVHREISGPQDDTSPQLDWLSQPLSGRGLAWTVNVLVVFAGLLLFALVFLSVTREAPRWPLAVFSGMACVVTLMYWGFFQMFGGSSLGTRLARLAVGDSEDEESINVRFR